MGDQNSPLLHVALLVVCVMDSVLLPLSRVNIYCKETCLSLVSDHIQPEHLFPVAMEKLVSGALSAIHSDRCTTFQPVQHHDKDTCFDDFHGILVIDMPKCKKKRRKPLQSLLFTSYQWAPPFRVSFWFRENHCVKQEFQRNLGMRLFNQYHKVDVGLVFW